MKRLEEKNRAERGFDPALKAPLQARILRGRLDKQADVAGVTEVAAFMASSDADGVTGTTTLVHGGLRWNGYE